MTNDVRICIKYIYYYNCYCYYYYYSNIDVFLLFTNGFDANKHLPSKSLIVLAGSVDFINVSPTRQQLTPISLKDTTSSRTAMPLKAAIVTSGCSCDEGEGLHLLPALSTASIACLVVSKSNLKVCKFRLFTPMHFAPHLNAAEEIALRVNPKICD